MGRKAKHAASTTTDKQKRNRRTPEQLIADLQAQIQEVKRRAATRQIKESGEGKALLVAIKALDKVLAVAKGETQDAVEAARAILAKHLASLGFEGAGGGSRTRRSSEDLDQLCAVLLEHVQKNPGVRLEQISAALGEPSKDLKRPVQLLLAAGELRTEGQKRGTQYFAGAGQAQKKDSAPARAKSGPPTRARAKR